MSTQVLETQGELTKELSAKRRAAWLKSINRKDWNPGPGARVCSSHFLSGKPAALFDHSNPDWTPSVHMGYEMKSGDVDRYHRIKKRKLYTSSSLEVGDECLDDTEEHSTGNTTEAEVGYVDASSQTDDYVASLEMDNTSLRTELLQVRKTLGGTSISIKHFKENDEMVKFYTGLPNWKIFNAVMTLAAPSLPKAANSKVTTFQMLLMFFMKVRLNLFEEDIGHRFGVHRATVSRNFHKVLNVMYVKLSHLIKWPSREILRETLPSSFRRFFKNCCVIIDCSEVFIEQPTDLRARAQVWSNYKHHSTMKFLIGITPQGTISYVSKCAGGRISDKQIVEQSNLINYLLPGDVIIADRGFTCNEYARMALAEVKIPPFTKGKKQLEKVQVDWSRELSIVRIHVERLIGVLKQKYTILQNVLPIKLLANKDDEGASIDRLVTVCCALVNLCPSVVPQD